MPVSGGIIFNYIFFCIFDPIRNIVLSLILQIFPGPGRPGSPGPTPSSAPGLQLQSTAIAFVLYFCFIAIPYIIIEFLYLSLNVTESLDL